MTKILYVLKLTSYPTKLKNNQLLRNLKKAYNVNLIFLK